MNKVRPESFTTTKRDEEYRRIFHMDYPSQLSGEILAEFKLETNYPLPNL